MRTRNELRPCGVNHCNNSVGQENESDRGVASQIEEGATGTARVREGRDRPADRDDSLAHGRRRV